MKCLKCKKSNCMLVSPSYCVEDWKDIKDNLPLDSNNESWRDAINIFDDRIKNRFLKQVDCLVHNSDISVLRYSGFVIMSIDCLLIETLNQFYLGIKSTANPNWKAFNGFFKNSQFFNSSFQPFTRDLTSKSRVFYVHIRCGLLHQAETREQSKINLQNTKMIQYVDVDKPQNGIVVNRAEFHTALVNEFENYKKCLYVITNQELRTNFIKKMNMICRTT